MRKRDLAVKRPSGEELDRLVASFREIGTKHAAALVRHAARVVLGASVMRVFRRGTNGPLRSALSRIDPSPLGALRSAHEYERWHQHELDRIGRAIWATNADNPRVQHGYKWGHGAKVLALFVRELVLSSRYFPDAVAHRLEPWLYAPVDRIALGHLKRLGIARSASSIKQIDSHAEFREIQNMLGEAAARAGVPRVWFDDLWLERT